MKRLMMKTIIDYQNDEREKVLLDVRDKQEFEKETYPGARNWYWEELIKVLEETPEEFTQQFDKSVPIYLLCYTGLHSDDLADILEEMGYITDSDEFSNDDIASGGFKIGRASCRERV